MGMCFGSRPGRESQGADVRRGVGSGICRGRGSAGRRVSGRAAAGDGERAVLETLGIIAVRCSKAMVMLRLQAAA